MISDRHKRHRGSIIDICDSYIKTREKFDSVIGIEEGDGIDLESFKKKVHNLKNGKFILAIVGEVKSGKSTFINALLGADVLPTAALQATSSIIEIFKSKNPCLIIKYADGSEEKIDDDLNYNEIRNKLNKVGQLSKEYRDIPTTVIDQDIIASDSKIEISEDLIQNWESKSSFKDLSQKKDLLETYISSRPKSSIPTSIEFGYPLEWDLNELRIVDSPGINAVGGVQNVSFSYFERANAILFIKRIQPIESEAFNEFVNKMVSKRIENTLFLVLTHIQNHKQSDVDELYKDAIRIYGKDIKEDRILPVDSFTQLIINDFGKGKTKEEIEDEDEQKSDILAKFEKRSKKQNQDLNDILEQASGFNKVRESINNFSAEAIKLQLVETLELLQEAYLKQENLYNTRAEDLDNKKKDPQEIVREIGIIQETLDKYKPSNELKHDKLSSLNFIESSDLIKKINEFKDKYTKLIEESIDNKNVRKNTSSGIGATEEIKKHFFKEIENEFKEKEIELKCKDNVTLSEVDLVSLEDDAKENMFREEIWNPKRERYELFEVVSNRFYNYNKHFESYKDLCKKKLDDLIDELGSKFGEIINDSFLYHFEEKLDIEKKNQKDNETLIKKVKELNEKRQGLEEEKVRIITLLEDLK